MQDWKMWHQKCSVENAGPSRPKYGKRTGTHRMLLLLLLLLLFYCQSLLFIINYYMLVLLSLSLSLLKLWVYFSMANKRSVLF